MKKVKIFTLVDHRPDFIKLQHESLKKYVKDADWEYIVLNNALKSLDRTRKGNPLDVDERNGVIEKICTDEDIQSIRVKMGEEFRITNGNVNFREGAYFCGVTATSYALNWAWNKYLADIYEDCIVIILDSDMFLVNDVNFNGLMSGYDMAFIPQYRGAQREVFYPWNGIFMAKPSEMINSKEIDWDLGTIKGHRTDIGGYSHYYLEKYMNQLNILYLEFWNVGDILEDGKRKVFPLAHLNGNARFDFILEGNVCKEFKPGNNGEDSLLLGGANKVLPYEREREDYQQYIIDNFLEAERFLIDRGVNFPHPIWIDLIKTQDQQIKESFIFHYKSGSNYQPFATPEYNSAKTQELRKLLGEEK